MSESLKCGSCRYWYKRPTDAATLGQPPKGECRFGPPHATHLPQTDAMGRVLGLATVTAYPQPGADCNACHQYAGKTGFGVEAREDDGEIE